MKVGRQIKAKALERLLEENKTKQFKAEVDITFLGGRIEDEESKVQNEFTRLNIIDFKRQLSDAYDSLKLAQMWIETYGKELKHIRKEELKDQKNEFKL